jgi:hypothetical protein
VGRGFARRAGRFSAALAQRIDPVVSGPTIMAASLGARTLFSVGTAESPDRKASDRCRIFLGDFNALAGSQATFEKIGLGFLKVAGLFGLFSLPATESSAPLPASLDALLQSVGSPRER